jgi:hypothetical protein
MTHLPQEIMDIIERKATRLHFEEQVLPNIHKQATNIYKKNCFKRFMNSHTTSVWIRPVNVDAHSSNQTMNNVN